MIRLVAIVLFLATCLPADACSKIGGAPTLSEMVTTADEVFIARVVSAKEKFSREGDEVELYVEGRYRLIETLKGRPQKTGVVHDLPLAPGNCSLGLMVGWDYVFMIHNAGSPELKNWVGSFSGSFPLGPYRDSSETQKESDLDELRTILKKQQELGNK